MVSFGATTVFRDFIDDGIPSSGKHNVKKEEVRDWGLSIESAIGMAVLTQLVFDTKAALLLHLTAGNRAPALVIGDPTEGNDGIYMKLGAVGTGSWSQLSDQVPGTQFVRAVDEGAGTPNAIEVTSMVAVQSTGGQLIYTNLAVANTSTSVTIRFNGGPWYNIKTISGNDPVAGTLPAQIIGVISGINFNLITDLASGSVQAGLEQVAAEAALSAQQAESARDAAFALGPKYTTEALGRAAVADGETFFVQGNGDDVAAFEYRRINSTTSVFLTEYPSNSGVKIATSALKNLWDDPYFEKVKSKKATRNGRPLFYSTATNGFYNKSFATALGGKGAWQLNTADAGQMAFNVWLDEYGVVPGDVISIGALAQSGVGENYRIFYRFFGPLETNLLGSQVAGPVITGTGLVQKTGADNLVVPANATGLFIGFNDTTPVAINFALLALWCVRGSSSGLTSPKRTGSAVAAIDQALMVTSNASIFPDPRFSVLKGSTITIGGENLFHSTFNNRVYDQTIKHSQGYGAWKHSAASATLTGFKKSFDGSGIDVGDRISVGAVLKGAAIGGRMVLAVRQIGLTDTTYVDAGATTITVDTEGQPGATGEEQTFVIEGITVLAGATGVIMYYYDSTPTTDVFCTAMWVVRGSVAGASPPTAVNSKLIEYLGAGGVDTTPVVSADAVILPPRICAVAGRSLKLRNSNLRIGTGPRSWNWDGTNGRQDNDGYIYTTPVAGEYTITASIHEPDIATLLGSAASVLSVQNANAPSGAARKLMVIGDSLTAANTWTQRLLDVDAANANSVQLTMIGTQGAAPNKHEGRGGWSVPRYHSPGVTYFASNPFTETSASKFNFSYYLTNTAQATPDIVAIMLGINDVFGQTSDAAAKSMADASIVMLDEIIGLTAGAGVTSLKSVSPTIKTLLVIEPFGHDEQDSYGVDYSLGQSQYRGRRNIGIYAKTLIDHYAASEADNVFLCAAHAVLDLTADYTSNGVHPNTTGYNKIGDTVSDYINTMVAKGVM